MNIETLEQVEDTLQNLGYETKLDSEAVAFKVGDFVSVATISEDGKLVINCQVATEGQIQNDEFFAAALDANSRISPYAFALLTPENDGIEGEGQVVLTDSIPMLDLDPVELQSSVDSLRQALIAGGPALRVGLSG